jgi:hypothetical protein
MKPINECKTVAELLETPERWIKGKHVRLNNGEEGNIGLDILNSDLKKACAFCLEGAIIYLYGYGTDEALAATTNVRLCLDTDYIFQFNDNPSTTHQQVLEVVRKAGI